MGWARQLAAAAAGGGDLALEEAVKLQEQTAGKFSHVFKCAQRFPVTACLPHPARGTARHTTLWFTAPRSAPRTLRAVGRSTCIALAR